MQEQPALHPAGERGRAGFIGNNENLPGIKIFKIRVIQSRSTGNAVRSPLLLLRDAVRLSVSVS